MGAPVFLLFLLLNSYRKCVILKLFIHIPGSVMMIIKINPSRFGRFFNVPCSVVDKYLLMSDGDYIKILLCILAGDTDTADTDVLSRQSGLDEAKVKDAILYWTGCGVISCGDTYEENTPVPKAIAASAPAEQAAAPKAETPVKPAARLTLNPSDLARRLESSAELKMLVSEYEKLKGCDIKHSELIGFINLTDYYGLDVQSLLLIVNYCHDLGKDSIAYIESVAKDWISRGIDTYPEVEAEIIRQQRTRSFENKVLSSFGISGKPTKRQLEYIHSWQQLGMNEGLIALAYEICMDNISKFDFRYTDKIIRGWSDNKIYTVKDAKEARAKYSSGKQSRGGNTDASYNIDEWVRFSNSFDPSNIGGKK